MEFFKSAVKNEIHNRKGPISAKILTYYFRTFASINNLWITRQFGQNISQKHISGVNKDVSSNLQIFAFQGVPKVKNLELL